RTSEEQLDLSNATADHTINEKIEFIKENAGDRSKKSDIKTNIAALTKLAEWYGLSSTQLEEVLDVVLDSKLDEADNNKLAKSLVPRDKVPEMLAIHVLGHLGQSVLKFTTQAILLRWVVIAYNLLDNHSKLQLLYGVVFHYLEYNLL
ncbi:1270_t:CDS:2, partial [Paraglomus occultum]